MKKIALIAFLLIVCVAAGRAQESRQDISLSGTALVEPYIASATNAQVSANRAFGALVSYRFMLTPSSAIEANYGITYQNKIHYNIGLTNNYTVLTRTQEMSAAYVRSFNFRKYNPFIEAGPGAFIFLPSATLAAQTSTSSSRLTSAPSMESGSLAKSVPASTFAPSSAAWSPKCPPSTTRRNSLLLTANGTTFITP